MALVNWDDDPNPYISTDPYAGDARDPNAPPDSLPVNPTPGDFGPYAQDFTPGGMRAPTVPAETAGSAYSGDPSNVDAWLAWMAQQPGHDPILDTPQGQAYYKQRITETGGLSASNQSYWQNKSTLAANGGAVGAPEGGTGNLWSQAPTLDQLQNMPGFQFALQNGEQGVNRSAAAKGTALTGGTLKDLSDYDRNMSLNAAFFPYWQLQNQSTQNNAGNLYSLAALGLNASSQGYK